ncbi:cyclic AMP-dependent transcription factor ATF-5 [Microcaecilia unicolor]|uniref:Cyclic AMP-dependent transcription factor ATF-5 n=1 Tax=Microcaecilia unicolor TaxID=1415580 RepID=A0A6P7XT23_9AMPH|nr:cyclic AMP-dependent transcription factor ATF-5 [Microcaecilia unicolor]
MSLLAALNLDLEVAMLPASALQWWAELLKIPAHGSHCEHLVGLMEDGGSPHGTEPGSLAGDGFTDWMTERVDFSSYVPVAMDSSLSAPPAPDLETMATLLKKELEQMEDYFLEDTLSPGLPLPPDQVAPSTPPSQEAHFHFTVPEPALGGRLGEFQTFVPDAVSSASASLETLDSGGLELLNLYCDVPREYPREDLQNLGISNVSDPPAQSKRGSRPTPYERPTNVTLGGPAAPPQQKSDRKQKKRDQNKTAALRYRQRKRAEYDALDEECQNLEVRNRELKEKSDSIEREIQYVKDLLIEVYKARSQRLRNT